MRTSGGRKREEKQGGASAVAGRLVVGGVNRALGVWSRGGGVGGGGGGEVGRRTRRLIPTSVIPVIRARRPCRYCRITSLDDGAAAAVKGMLKRLEAAALV